MADHDPRLHDHIGTEVEEERERAAGVWLGAVRPFVVEHLPPAPARVLEIGCGPMGGFVPALLDLGYDAIGVDPEAPDGASYRQTTFETHAQDHPVDVIVACTSLHHVADLDDVLGRVVGALAPHGTLIVIEWAWERFDEGTARWCFERLPPQVRDGEHGWLHGHRDRWVASGKPWNSYLRSWAIAESLHEGRQIRRAVETRFAIASYEEAPYVFPEVGVSEALECAAVDSGEIHATGDRYVARLM